ncbi:MAG: methylated-DNA--[protein]-cysteine S-methyltransferase [Planctomycetes bacterium]|nr:methylated-DNA--[protein]-cysteine S-methyltransferase [Planctomycetota bacterium]
MYYGYFNVYGFKPLRKIFAARTRKGVCFVELLAQQSLRVPEGCVAISSQNTRLLRQSLARTTKLIKDNAAFNDIRDALTGYFAGKTTSFNMPVDLSTGTRFQQRVWRKLKEIPYGEVRTYKWVAEGIGLPKGVRAIGQACASNPIPIIIPCHRVIRTDGNLGGYSSGVALKKQLLRLEGRTVDNGLYVR